MELQGGQFRIDKAMYLHWLLIAETLCGVGVCVDLKIIFSKYENLKDLSAWIA